MTQKEYLGEMRDLSNRLDGVRQAVAHERGTDHPLFRIIHEALLAPTIHGLRSAWRAVEAWEDPQSRPLTTEGEM